MYNLKSIFGAILVLTSIFDAWKYIWQTKAIIKTGTARGHSRKFLNAAIFNDIIKLMYGLIIHDLFIIASSSFSLITMCYNFYIVYLYYPYKMRGCINFKRPSVFLFILNSWTPNIIRKRL
jgi:hypothetical protein